MASLTVKLGHYPLSAYLAKYPLRFLLRLSFAPLGRPSFAPFALARSRPARLKKLILFRALSLA